MAKLPVLNRKWKQDIHDNLAKYSLIELVDEVGWLGGGDDYDGVFTDRGTWEFEYAKKLLKQKIAALQEADDG